MKLCKGSKCTIGRNLMHAYCSNFPAENRDNAFSHRDWQSSKHSLRELTQSFKNTQ